jgi:hypothetical protein
MQSRFRWASLIAVACILAGGELLACGDKFLVAGRGTRYQRPKNARAASVIIYANPSSDRMQSFLERQGHHAVAVTTLDQLSAAVSSRRFDVILAAADVAAKIQQMMAGVPDAAVVVTLDAAPKPAMLLNAIDKAVEQHDQPLQRNRTRS